MSDKVNQIKDLEVKYHSNTIQDLYSSSITIKNIGNSIVKEQDITPLCPITISTSGMFLTNEYEYIESHPINKISNYSLSFSSNGKIDNCVKFNFDYIPQKAVITFSLFHTGNITFNGDLMDGEIITPDENQKKQKIKRVLWNIFTYTITFLISFLLTYFFTHTGGSSR